MKSLVALLFIILYAINLYGQNKSDHNHPNIIFFFTDDQAYDTQKDFGNPDVKTPSLDQLAKNGVVFLMHYNTTASRSMVSILR